MILSLGMANPMDNLEMNWLTTGLMGLGVSHSRRRRSSFFPPTVGTKLVANFFFLFFLFSFFFLLLSACGQDNGGDGSPTQPGDPDAGLPRRNLQATLEWADIEPELQVSYVLWRQPRAVEAKRGTFAVAELALTLEQAVAEGVSYQLDLWVDRDQDSVCGSPLTDPGFRIEIPAVAGDVAFTHAWHRGFVDVCPAWNGTVPSGKPLTLTGKVLGGAGIEETNAVKRGKPVPGARVFLKGAPELFAVTAEDGTFSLETVVPAGLLAEDSGKVEVLSYFSMYGSGLEKDQLRPSIAKYAKVMEAEFDGIQSAIEVGSVELGHSRRINLILNDPEANALTGCWVTVPHCGQHLNITESASTAGKYEVDEAAAGVHVIAVACPERELQTFQYTVEEADTFSVFDTIPLTVQ